jgi:tRNA-binding EMAP/Myf-like protein
MLLTEQFSTNLGRLVSFFPFPTHPVSLNVTITNISKASNSSYPSAGMICASIFNCPVNKVFEPRPTRLARYKHIYNMIIRISSEMNIAAGISFWI